MADMTDPFKIIHTSDDAREVYSLVVNGARIAELTVINEADKAPRIMLEFLTSGSFDWKEAHLWIPGLVKLAEVGDGLTSSKPDVERLLHQPTDEEMKMAKAKAKAKQKKADKKAGKPSAPRETAAAMFQELIMAGNLTDDKIFAKVKDKFGLDDKKRSYVAWYRNKLKKDGKKPPEARE